MSSIKIITIGVSIVSILFLNGCSSAKGPQFTEYKKPQENHGMLYVYRSSILKGSAIDYNIYIKNNTMKNYLAGELVNGSYLEVDLPIGESKILMITQRLVERTKALQIDIKNGEVLCVKGGEDEEGFTPGTTILKIVDMAKCKSEIVKTKRAE